MSATAHARHAALVDRPASIPGAWDKAAAAAACGAWTARPAGPAAAAARAPACG